MVLFKRTSKGFVKKWISLFFIFFFLGCVRSREEKPLKIYSSRKPHLIKPLLDIYTEETGVRVELVTGKAGTLIQKLRQEGTKTPADLLITVDVGNLWQASEWGLLAPLKSRGFDKIPKEFRDTGNRWVGLSLRSRTLFYNNQKVKKEELKNYEDLASGKWKGRLCLRTSRKVYNQSLVAAMMIRLGEKPTEEMVRGWVRNLSRPVFTSDTQLLEAIDRGDCHVGLANTYYLARLIKKDKGKNVSLFWPSGDNGGVHVNISGGGVVTHSSRPRQAKALLEWFAGGKAQKIFAELNDEYPVLPGVPVSPLLRSWGDFKPESLPLGQVGSYQKKAVLLMDRARYR